MLISIASGKGGTGKTTVAVNLALALENIQLLDCDVEEPNSHIFLKPEILEEKPVFIKVPKIDRDKCTFCGKCSEFCEFNSLFVVKRDPERDIKGEIMTFPNLCHGCKGCAIVCPEDAIAYENRVMGVVKKCSADGMNFVYGELNVGEPMAVPVIKAVKNEIDDKRTVMIDSPPGTSCPAVNSIYGSDFCLLVTEPTPFGLYDMKLMIAVLRELDIPFGVIINRSGIGDEGVYEYCKSEGIEIMLEIPYDRRIAELYATGSTFLDEIEGWKKKFTELFERIEEAADL
ncbi:MAG: ATP-binding protein [Halobacteriota archaeon]|nr:ATP-binding protein [Halobacteriota archaeon]